MAFNLSLFRTVTFGVATLFAVILLGLNAHVLSQTFTASRVVLYFDFAALAVATCVLTLVSLPVMYIIDIKRNGAFTSWVAVEYACLSLLWVLWLATAARSAEWYRAWFSLGGGSCSDYSNTIMTLCSELATTIALGFVTWLLLMGYSITLLTFAIMSQNRGNKGVWKGSVRNLSMAPVEGTEKGGSPIVPAPTQPIQPYQTPVATPGYPPAQPQYQYQQPNSPQQQQGYSPHPQV